MGIPIGFCPQRYAFPIQLMAQHYSISDVCHVLRVPRSAYYAWLNRRPSQRAGRQPATAGKNSPPSLWPIAAFTAVRVCASVCKDKASLAAAIAWPATCAPCSSKPAKNGLSVPKPPTPIIRIPSPPTGSGRSVALRASNRVWSAGISPISPPRKAGFIWPAFWTFTAGRSDGPPATHWKHPW